MADRPPRPRTEGARGEIGGMRRWVKVALIVVAVVALLFVAVALTGGSGGHGPGRHGGSAGSGGGTSPAVAEHVPPAGTHG